MPWRFEPQFLLKPTGDFNHPDSLQTTDIQTTKGSCRFLSAGLLGAGAAEYSAGTPWLACESRPQLWIYHLFCRMFSSWPQDMWKVVLGIHLGVTDFGVDLPKARLKLRHTISYSNLNGQKQVHESKARGIANKTMNTRNWSKSWARVEFSRINTGTTGYMFVCILIFFANLTSGDRPEKMFGLGVEARARFTF